MIRLADGTEWNDDDYHAQLAQRHGCTRAQAKNYNVLRNYMGAFTPEELQGAIRAGGKSAQLWEDITSALTDLPKGKRLYIGRRGAGMSKSLLGEAQARFLAQEPEKPTYLLGSGRRAATLGPINWDEMVLYGGSWYMIDEHGMVWDCGIDWGSREPDPCAGYAVVRRITRNTVTLEMRDAEDQATGIHPLWSTGRGRHGAFAGRSRRDCTRGAELLLHRWGSDVEQLLRGIREREAADRVEDRGVRIHPGGNDRRRFSASSRA